MQKIGIYFGMKFLKHKSVLQSSRSFVVDRSAITYQNYFLKPQSILNPDLPLTIFTPIWFILQYDEKKENLITRRGHFYFCTMPDNSYYSESFFLYKILKTTDLSYSLLNGMIFYFIFYNSMYLLICHFDIHFISIKMDCWQYIL